MPLQLQPRQLQQLAERRYFNKLRDILSAGAADPAATRAELASPAGEAQLRAQVGHAKRHGLSAELDVARYVICAWLLGADFDTRFAALAEVLASDRLTPSQMGEALEHMSTTLLQTLSDGAKR